MAKESLYTSETPSKIMYRETFQDEHTLRRNGGVPTDITFEDGVASFNGQSGKISYFNPFSGIPKQSFSIRVRFTHLGAGSVGGWGILFMQGNYDNGLGVLVNDSGFLNFYGVGAYLSSSSFDKNKQYEFVFIYDGSTLYIYRDGEIDVSSARSGDARTNIVNTFEFGHSSSGTEYYGNLSIDLFEIYNYALTAEECYNLFHGKRYKALTTPTPILDIRSDAGIYDAQGNSLTNTDVEVVRDGDVRVMGFNGSTSSLALGTTIYHKNIETISFWYKSLSGKLISNQAFLYTPNVGTHSILLIIEGDSVIKLYSEDTTGVNALEYNIISYDDGCWHNYIFVRNVGTAYLYIDGVLVKTDNLMKTGEEIQYSKAIGRRVSDFYLNGSLSGMKIIQNYVMSAEEASQLYTSEKHLYQ